MHDKTEENENELETAVNQKLEKIYEDANRIDHIDRTGFHNTIEEMFELSPILIGGDFTGTFVVFDAPLKLFLIVFSTKNTGISSTVTSSSTPPKRSCTVFHTCTSTSTMTSTMTIATTILNLHNPQQSYTY
jgi:hypothetical protein